MLASRTTNGLLGLDCSIDFSAAPLDHVVLVIHGLGDQYTDSPPWLTALETNLAALQSAVSRVHDPRSRRATPPAVLLVPLEYHSCAQRDLSAALRPAVPGADGPAPAVRVGIAETVGDVLLAASPRFRASICAELKAQALEQLAAVRRARPAFASGRVSVFAHSTGSVYALQMLAEGMFDDLPGFDALVLAGACAPAYFALDLEYSERLRKGVVERREGGTRVVNVFHALDPASFRLEPWIDGTDRGRKGSRASLAPVRVGKLGKQTLWKEATSLWGGTVHNVMTALFPERATKSGAVGDERLEMGAGPGGDSEARRIENDRTRNGNSGEMLPRRRNGSNYGAMTDTVSPNELQSPQLALSGSNTASANQPGSEMRRNRSYLLIAPSEDEEDVPVGPEVLLGDRVDYELEDRTDSSHIDVVANWSAVNAHGFYWRSPDVAQILVDIAGTSSSAVKKQADLVGASSHEHPVERRRDTAEDV